MATRICPPARALFIFLMLSLAGCATGPDDRHWGGDTTLLPGWGNIGNAARDALLDPLTWVPLAGAVIFSIDDLDEEVSDWAVDHTPLFGSVEDAEDASNTLRNITTKSYYISAAATPSGNEAIPWVVNKSRAIAVGYSTMWLTDQIVDELKIKFDRQRPAGGSNDSLPSGHTASATVRATLAARNIDAMKVSDTTRTWLKVGVYSAAGLTGWARVEGRRHFPSDVLAGFAIGHVMGAFVNDAFVQPNTNQDLQLNAARIPDGWQMGFTLRF